jgi:hypothetical protein
MAWHEVQERYPRSIKIPFMAYTNMFLILCRPDMRPTSSLVSAITHETTVVRPSAGEERDLERIINIIMLKGAPESEVRKTRIVGSGVPNVYAVAVQHR